MNALTLSIDKQDDAEEDMDLLNDISSSDYPCYSIALAQWKALDERLQEAWSAWAKLVNDRPFVGVFEELPDAIVAYGIEELMKKNLEVDWKVSIY